MKSMIKKSKRLLSAFIAVVFCFLVALSPTQIKTGAVDSTAKGYQDQISALAEKQTTLKSKLASLKDEVSDAMEYKSSLDELSNITMEKISVAESLSAELEQNIASTEASIAEKEEAIEKTFNNFLERIRVSYEEGEASYLSIILGSESMADFLSRMDMVSSMLDYDKSLKEQYESEKAALEAERESLSEAKALQEQNLEDLKADKAEYDALSTQQENYISSLEADVSSTTAAYEAAKKQENELNKQLESYLASLQEKEQSSYVGGEFIWPLKGYTYVSSGFGWRTLNGANDYHLGIDIPAPIGTPIYACNGGTVVTATNHGSYGNYVVINHGGGKSTLYAHMSSIAVSAGETVSQNQVIGYVGVTGYVTGAHVHVEVRINGTANNPLNYLSK